MLASSAARKVKLVVHVDLRGDQAEREECPRKGAASDNASGDAEHRVGDLVSDRDGGTVRVQPVDRGDKAEGELKVLGDQ